MAVEKQRTKDEGRVSSNPCQCRGRLAPAKAGAKSAARKNEIINDPAVKTVLIGLDATITGIEEN